MKKLFLLITLAAMQQAHCMEWNTKTPTEKNLILSSTFKTLNEISSHWEQFTQIKVYKLLQEFNENPNSSQVEELLQSTNFYEVKDLLEYIGNSEAINTMQLDPAQWSEVIHWIFFENKEVMAIIDTLPQKDLYTELLTILRSDEIKQIPDPNQRNAAIAMKLGTKISDLTKLIELVQEKLLSKRNKQFLENLIQEAHLLNSKDNTEVKKKFLTKLNKVIVLFKENVLLLDLSEKKIVGIYSQEENKEEQYQTLDFLIKNLDKRFIYKLNLADNNITSLDFVELKKLLPSLHTVDLSHNYITILDLDNIAQSGIVVINLDHNKIMHVNFLAKTTELPKNLYVTAHNNQLIVNPETLQRQLQINFQPKKQRFPYNPLAEKINMETWHKKLFSCIPINSLLILISELIRKKLPHQAKLYMLPSLGLTIYVVSANVFDKLLTIPMIKTYGNTSSSIAQLNPKGNKSLDFLLNHDSNNAPTNQKSDITIKLYNAIASDPGIITKILGTLTYWLTK